MRIFALALLLVCPATVYPADTCVAPADEDVHTGPEEEVWSAWTLDLEEDETAARSEELEKWQAEWETWKAEIEAREAETRPHMDRYKTVMGEAKADRARMLAKRGDVRSLLAAAVLMQQNASGDDPWNQKALGYLDAAQRRGGSEPLVWWLTAIMCHADSPVCDRPAARATLAALDPDKEGLKNA